MVIRDLGSVPGGPKITPKKIRSGIQKYVAKINRQMSEEFQRALMARYAAALAGLTASGAKFIVPGSP
jgi:hypothetical protein